MVYPFMTLNDGTVIVHSEMQSDGCVKVSIETPDEKLCFKHAVCRLPQQERTDIYGYSDSELTYLKELIESKTPMILESSQPVIYNL